MSEHTFRTLGGGGYYREKYRRRKRSNIGLIRKQGKCDDGLNRRDMWRKLRAVTNLAGIVKICISTCIDLGNGHSVH